MRTFTTTHTVYTFDELSDEAKQKAIEKQRDFENEYGLKHWLPDEMDYQLSELLRRYKMKCDDAKVYYSLTHSQGDGAMFEGTVYWGAWRIEVRQSGHYYHYNSKQFWNFESVKTGREPSDKTLSKFNEAYVALCRELERAGYHAIDYALSDEVLIENIKANGHEFYEDGRRV